MKKENVSDIVNHIDGKFIDEATMFALNNEQGADQRSAQKSSRRPSRARWGVLAACLALIIVLGSGAAAFVAEAKEYNNAVAFFEENGLSTEGLSRAEVKAVYRDITEKKFSYGKTAEVMMHAVPGWEIWQREPTPEELAELWDKNVWRKTVSHNDISYLVDYEYSEGAEFVTKSILECYLDGALLWTAEFNEFFIDGYSYTKDGTAVWGYKEGQYNCFCWIALVDDEGSVVWKRRLEHGFSREYVASMLNYEGGTWAVFSRGDLRYLCLSYYDADGNELSFHKTEVGNFGIENAARLGDGFIVQLWNKSTGDTARICTIDSECNLTDSFSYESDNCDYYITDMIAFEGQVYLSAYATPKQRNTETGRDEIANILDYIFSKEDGGWDISSEELTPIVRDNYTAILLMCDPEGGAPITFYSVNGSLGDSLYVNDAGQLEWRVDSITSTFFSTGTSSFTIVGNCDVFCYIFDSDGTLTGQTDTKDSVPYRR